MDIYLSEEDVKTIVDAIKEFGELCNYLHTNHFDLERDRSMRYDHISSSLDGVASAIDRIAETIENRG